MVFASIMSHYNGVDLDAIVEGFMTNYLSEEIEQIEEEIIPRREDIATKFDPTYS